MERYIEAVHRHLSRPSRCRDIAFSDVDVLLSVFSASIASSRNSPSTRQFPEGRRDNAKLSPPLLQPSWSGFSPDEGWWSVFQQHCAEVLIAGVTNGFIRRDKWVELVGAMGREGTAACPHLSAAMAWALAHETAPFGAAAHLSAVDRSFSATTLGGDEDIVAACRAWVLLTGKGENGGRTPSSFGCLKADNASVGGSTIDLPGIGCIDALTVELCLKTADSMGLMMASPWEWGAVLNARLLS